MTYDMSYDEYERRAQAIETWAEKQYAAGKPEREIERAVFVRDLRREISADRGEPRIKRAHKVCRTIEIHKHI